MMRRFSDSVMSPMSSEAREALSDVGQVLMGAGA
jgi:hypothetical protein